MPTDPVDASKAYIRNPAVLAASLGADHVALLGESRDNYHGLAGPAARIWELLETPQTIAALCRALIDEFDVDPAECASDTRAFLATLLEQALVLEQPADMRS